jgi:hypothetical protein
MLMIGIAQLFDACRSAWPSLEPELRRMVMELASPSEERPWPGPEIPTAPLDKLFATLGKHVPELAAHCPHFELHRECCSTVELDRP